MKNLVHKETSAPALGIVISDTEAGAPIASRIDDNLDPPVALAIAESVLWIIVIWYVAAAAEESRRGAELEQCLSRARQSTDADALRQCLATVHIKIVATAGRRFQVRKLKLNMIKITAIILFLKH